MWLVTFLWGLTIGCRSRRGQTELVVFGAIQVQVTGDGGPIVCCAGLSTSAIMGSFWELSFKKNIGKSGACLVEGDQKVRGPGKHQSKDSL